MNNLLNFAAGVSWAVRNDIKQLAELTAAWIDTLNGDTLGDDPKIEACEYKSRDGFISFNSGGFSVSQSYACGNGSGIYHTVKEGKFIDRLSNDALKDYCSDNSLDVVTFFDRPDGDREAFYDYENEYLDDCYTIIECEIFVISDSGKIQVSLLAHYQDAPYMRNKHAEVIYSHKFSREDFAPALIMEQIKTAYAAA